MCKTRANARGRLKKFAFCKNLNYFHENENFWGNGNAWKIFANIFAKMKIFPPKRIFARKRNFAKMSPGIKDGCAGQDPLHRDPVLLLCAGVVQRLTDGA